MTVKKNVFPAVAKNFINMAEEDENVPSAVRPLESIMVSQLSAGEARKNG